MTNDIKTDVAASGARARRTDDIAATRAALLTAGRRLFADRGFEGVTLRDVADLAQADAALVSRYFGSKEGLFVEAMTGAHASRFPEVLAVPDAELGRALTDYVLDPDKHADPGNPLVALLRSSAHPAAAELLVAAVDQGLTEPLARRLGGADARSRAALIAALLLGLSVARDVVGSRALTSEAPPDLTARTADVVQSLVDGRAVGGEPVVP